MTGPNPIKRGVASLLHGVGLTSLSFAVQRACLSPFIRVIYYHDVQPRMADSFEQQLRLFKELFAPASRSDLHELLTRGSWPHERPGVILTFDDGLRSHAEVVAPLLEKHGFQGWFFVPVNLVTIPASEQPAAAARHDVLHDCQIARDPRIFMTPRQVATLADRHIVGCHTATHLRLSKAVSETELASELGSAKQRLEALLGGRSVDSFSWVGGEEWAYSEAAAKIVARLFNHAFTTNTSVARPGTPPRNISRTHMECFFSPSLVRLQLSGMMDLYYRSKRKRLRSCLAPCSSATALEG